MRTWSRPLTPPCRDSRDRPVDQIAAAKAEFQALDHVVVGVFVLRRDYVVLFWNKCLEDWTGITRTDMVGTDVRVRYPHLGRPKVSARLEEVFERGASAVFSSQLHKYVIPIPVSDDQYRIQHTVVSPVASEGGDGFHAVFSISDVTNLTQYARNYRTMRDQALREVEERKRLIVDLQDALRKVKTLRGLIPICASCKKIRDDQGFWSQVEVYVREHSEAEFSHALCPDCAEKLYPELYDKDQKP